MKIEVYDRDLSPLGEVDDYDSCILTRPYRGHGKLEMLIPLDSLNAPLLACFNWIYAGPKRIYQILRRDVDTEDADMLHVIGMLGGQAWAMRNTIPPAGQDLHTVTGSRDAITKAYITTNAISPAQAYRAVPHIAVAADQAGDIITDSTGWLNVRDEIERVLASDDMGYCWDRFSGSVVYDTYKGSDRTAGQSILPPVIFALKYDNLLSRRYVQSYLDTENVMYVGGAGEGAARTIVEVGDAEGDSRFEGFTDARNTSDLDELANKGASAQRDGIETLEATVDGTGSTVYEQDFFLGDKVTAIDEKLGKTLDTRITEVREIAQKGQPDGLDITFGNAIPTDLHMIARQRRQINKLQAN